jgi:hypothetical protein
MVKDALGELSCVIHLYRKLADNKVSKDQRDRVDAKK